MYDAENLANEIWFTHMMDSDVFRAHFCYNVGSWFL